MIEQAIEELSKKVKDAEQVKAKAYKG